MNKLLKNIAVVLSLIAGSQAMEVESDWKVKKENLLACSVEIQVLILQTSATACFKEMSYSRSLEKLYFLRKNFYKGSADVINGCLVKNAIISAYDLREIDYENCLRHLNGKLIYLLENGETIELRFADLKKPFESEFDLSQCGDAGKYLSISTGYRKGRKPENANKVEIWIVLRSEIEKEFKNGRAAHFKGIMDKDYWKDNAPVGIFWTRGGWDNLGWYDYLTCENFEDISKNNLYKKWCAAATYNITDLPVSMVPTAACSSMQQKISCSF